MLFGIWLKGNKANSFQIFLISVILWTHRLSPQGPGPCLNFWIDIWPIINGICPLHFQTWTVCTRIIPAELNCTTSIWMLLQSLLSLEYGFYLQCRPDPSKFSIPSICHCLMTNITLLGSLSLGRDRSEYSGNMKTLDWILHLRKGKL